MVVVELPFFSGRKKIRLLPILITLVLLTTTSCVMRLKEEPFSVSFAEEIAETVLEPTIQPKPIPLEIEETVLELEDEILVENEENQEEKIIEDIQEEIILAGFYEIVSIDSETLTDWYRSFFRSLEVRRCSSNCTADEIEELLKPNREEWVVVQHGKVLYTHSGWPLFKNPFFGEMFLRILREDGILEESSFCLDEICFEIVDSVTLDRDEVGGLIPVEELFEVQPGDFFLVTCATRITPGLQTPKLILQLQLIQ